MRKTKTTEELLLASDALYYEIAMFNSLIKGMLSGIAGDSVINNALLESFTIHVRALLGFLYYDNRSRPDDIVAEDFFANPNDWISVRPSKTALLEKAHKRTDKEVAHLTYTRLDVTPEQKPWEYEPIANDLNKAIQTFLHLVSKDLLGDRWEDFKNARE